MTLPKVAGTKIRGDTYYLNLRIPRQAQAAFGGKTHLRDSLKTSDPRQAARDVTLAEAEIIEATERARQGARLDDAIAALPADQKRLLDEAGGLEGLLNEYQASRVAAAFSYVGSDDYGEPMDPREARLQEAQDRAAQAVIVDDAKQEAKVLTALGQDVEPLPVDAGVTGLRELADAYCEAKNTAPQTREAIAAVVRRFIEYGGDLDLADLTTAHLREYASAAKGLPKVTSSAKLRGLPMRKLIKIAKVQGLDTISDVTLGRHVSMLKALTAFAVPQGYMAVDPWAQFKVIKARTKHATQTRPRAPFLPADAGRILTHARQFDGATIDRWAPLLACYQGARREEIGQMMVGDIFEADGVWAMRITDMAEGQQIKNAASLRTIPLHPAVLAEGFQTFAAGKGGREGYLFCEQERWGGKLKSMVPDARQRVTEHYGKRFSRMLREKLEIKDRCYVFHSFRHLWEDAAEAAEMPQTHRRDLAGRSKAGDSQAGYGDGPRLKALQRSLAKIDPLAD